MDRPINPPTDPLDCYIEEAEQRWDSVFTEYERWVGSGIIHTHRSTVLGMLIEALCSKGFSRKILEEAITDQCDKLIQDLAQRLYERDRDNSKGYD